MSEFATYFENAIVNLMRATSFTEVNVYVALFTDSASPAELEAGTLTNEVSGGSYARQVDGTHEVRLVHRRHWRHVLSLCALNVSASAYRWGV